MMHEFNERLASMALSRTKASPLKDHLVLDLFNELIRQLLIECPERGLLATRIRNEISMTLDYYMELLKGDPPQLLDKDTILDAREERGHHISDDNSTPSRSGGDQRHHPHPPSDQVTHHTEAGGSGLRYPSPHDSNTWEEVRVNELMREVQELERQRSALEVQLRQIERREAQRGTGRAVYGNEYLNEMRKQNSDLRDMLRVRTEEQFVAQKRVNHLRCPTPASDDDDDDHEDNDKEKARASEEKKMDE